MKTALPPTPPDAERLPGPGAARPERTRYVDRDSIPEGNTPPRNRSWTDPEAVADLRMQAERIPVPPMTGEMPPPVHPATAGNWFREIVGRKPGHVLLAAVLSGFIAGGITQIFNRRSA